MFHATQTSVSANTIGNAARTIATEASATVSLTGAQQNELLRALSREELIAMFADLELVPLQAGKHLFDIGDKMDYAFFPTNAIISLQYVTEEGGATEIAVVGREGVVGVSMYETERANCSAVVQTSGYGYRVRASVLRNAFFSGGALAQQLMRHTSALFAQLAQTVAGVRHGSIEQRLCRWLLERLDRSLSNELKVTQEMIANMLGVRRESITCSAGKLQEEGLIVYRRGTVTVIDRAGMERRAGGCYTPA
ncbi:Crp/Fnr family transcriptional regulator [Duganella sp. FT27W]|uniref:Crp/Fnr family transcriptional regulator n=1 Tax=Duganella sp. FT27W TaxID=2654636 RepID=UPI00128CCD53|nr:Crp/Fnr family transcriptional regulator [Duganella sp. FT27W]MPQ57819.1 helix-turn-helix domain-containing protein [Duganella sp. FT27W]